MVAAVRAAWSGTQLILPRELQPRQRRRSCGREANASSSDNHPIVAWMKSPVIRATRHRNNNLVFGQRSRQERNFSPRRRPLTSTETGVCPAARGAGAEPLRPYQKALGLKDPAHRFMRAAD
jgi:hypothetical protein